MRHEAGEGKAPCLDREGGISQLVGMIFSNGLDPRTAFQQRLADAAERGMRIARITLVAFGIAVIGAIWLGAAVTDNGFAQIFVTFFATFALWPLVGSAAFAIDSRLRRWRRRSDDQPQVLEATAIDASWVRLARAAPAEQERIGAIQRSLATSHLALRDAKLDPDAHDLCVLIDRRLPELIERELDSLPPGDRERRERLGSLIGLVEDFARHCGRKREGRPETSEYQAEILRRRFEERLAPPSLKPQ